MHDVDPAGLVSAIKILRIREVMELLGIKRTTIYAMIKRGEFPEPIRLSPGAVGWRVDEITAWMESRSRGANELHQRRRKNQAS